jgi:hypothetical protein
MRGMPPKRSGSAVIALADRVLQTSQSAPAPSEWSKLAEEAATVREVLVRLAREESAASGPPPVSSIAALPASVADSMLRRV